MAFLSWRPAIKKERREGYLRSTRLGFGVAVVTPYEWSRGGGGAVRRSNQHLLFPFLQLPQCQRKRGAKSVPSDAGINY